MSAFWSIQTHPSLPSTQDLAKQLAAEGAPEGLVIQALQQTSGRGRHGREWVSEEGNLFISALLRPEIAADRVGELSLLTGVALGEAVRENIDDPALACLKWPNDILLDGQKCAGILVETNISGNQRLDWAVIGVGVNVAAAPAGMGHALADYGLKALDLPDFRDHFLKILLARYEQWTNEGFGPIKEAWLAGAHKAGAPVSVKTASQVVAGRFAGIDGRGGLLLETDEGLKTVTAGDVFWE